MGRYLIFQQYDGNEVVRIADDRKLYFFDKGGELISSDGTDLAWVNAGSLSAGAAAQVAVRAWGSPKNTRYG